MTQVLREDAEEILEGLLECTDPDCRHLYPVVDGIPILVGDLRRVVSEQILGILARDDVSETIMAVLGECCGPSSTLDARRQHLSAYCWSHWGDFDPSERRTGADGPATIVSILERGLGRLAQRGAPATGPIVDLGCSVGRTTLELAERTDGADLVLGIDLNLSMLRVARRALRQGCVRYARRHTGLVYEERAFAVPRERGGRVDFWCADAQSLPFGEASFALAVSLNLLDCVQSPLDHLKSLRDILRPGGYALVASPFDWSAGATIPQAWIGGHSPLGEAQGHSEHVLRSLVGGLHPAAIRGLEVIDEVDNLAWAVRLYERSTVQYQVDLFLLAKNGATHGAS